MKKLCFILLTMLPLTGITQTNGTLSISTHFQSEHNFISMARNDIMYMTCVEPMWHERFYYSTGLGVNYRFENQFEISSGIRYSKKREELNGYSYYNGCCDMFCGTVDYALIAVPPLTRHYIEIPVLARYYFLPGKFKLHVESGWMGSYRFDAQQASVNRWMLSAQSGAGVNLFLNRWQLGLDMNYRLQFDLGDRNNFYEVNPHAFGIEFKTAFSLNK